MMEIFDEEGMFKLPQVECGMFELSKNETCRHPSHSMPTHLYIPPGHGYRHKCPKCGHISVTTNTKSY